MAKRSKTKYLGLPEETKVELIGIKGDEVFKKVMTYAEAKNVKKAKGWQYYIYQVGFSQFKNVKTK